MHSRRQFLSALGSGAAGYRIANAAVPARTSCPHFVDIAAPAGLHAKTIIGGERAKKYILESTGGGVALFDYDNDGWLDIFLVNGSRMEGIPRGQEPVNHLYRNNRDGTFREVTAAAGLAKHGWGQGACAADYDNDGHTDLFVTYYGDSVLYRNNGNGTFTNVTRTAGLDSLKQQYLTGAAFVDFDRDGHADLFAVSYVDFDEAHRYLPENETTCRWKGLKVFCGPRGLKAGRCFLYRNNGDGTFSDVSDSSGVLAAGLAYGFTPLILDFDNDGWPDIYVACDSSRSLLFRNQRNGAFREVGLAAGVAVNEDGREQAGMGVGAGDYDGDGWLDIVKTNFADDTSTLYRNLRDGTFEDATFTAHLGGNTRYLGWGTGFFDFDNDGWPDIFVANGHVYPEVEGQLVDASYAERKILYRNRRNGTFDDISLSAGPGILTPRVARGVAFGDLFHTGRLDVVVNNMNDTPSLLHDTSENANHALEVLLVGEKSNRSALGARVECIAGALRQIEEVRSGGSFCSQNDFTLHFGLAANHSVDTLRVRWPSGKVEELRSIASGQRITMKEGAGVIAAHPFRAMPKLRE